MPNFARNRLLYADERIRRPGTGPIAAESQHHAILEECLPLVAGGFLLRVGVGAELAAAKARRRDIDHRKRSIAREVGVADRRTMFYPQPPVSRTVPANGLLVRIQN